MERTAVAACTISLIGDFKTWNMRNYGGKYLGREQVIRLESIPMEEKYELASINRTWVPWVVSEIKMGVHEGNM